MYSVFVYLSLAGLIALNKKENTANLESCDLFVLSKWHKKKIFGFHQKCGFAIEQADHTILPLKKKGW